MKSTKALNDELESMKAKRIGELVRGCRMAPADEWKHVLKHATKRVDQLTGDDFSEFRGVITFMLELATHRGWQRSAERLDKLRIIVRAEAYARAKTKREQRQVQRDGVNDKRNAREMVAVYDIWADAMASAARHRVPWREVMFFGWPESTRDLASLPASALIKALRSPARVAVPQC